MSGLRLGLAGRLHRRGPSPAAREQGYREVFRLAGMSRWELDVETGEVTAELDPAAPDRHLADGELRRPYADFLGLVHPDDRERLAGACEHAAATGTAFSLEYRVEAPGTPTSWRRVLASAVRDRRGRVTHLVGVAQDISRRKEAETQLRRMETRYRTLVERLPLASYIEQLGTGSASYISPQIQDLVGYTAEEWMSDPAFFGRVLHPDDRERVLSGFALMHSTGAAFDCEYRLIARDGREVWIHDAAVVVRDDDGRPLYAQGYMIDVTNQKRAEAALLDSRLELQRQKELAEHQALHDALTGLPNRLLFDDRAEQALLHAGRDGTRLAVMLIDLDGFKEINDTLGHASGDRLLREVAARLRKTVRASDTVARLGGDEFAVVAPGIFSPHAAVALAEKLQQEVSRPLSLGAITVEVEASLGIALFPDHGADVETLVRHADVAMYAGKAAHAPTLYSSEHDEHALTRLELVGELRTAIERGELVVHYQPQTRVATGEVTTVEALVRWQHPERGLVGPDAFIPVAEQTGLIRSVTRLVLDTALRQCSLWQGEGRRVGVAVNISARDLVDLGFPEEVAALLARWGVDPGLLELEITETTIMADLPRVESVLTALAALGVRLAVDDFGSGQWSFSYLRRLPIDVLKIDRSYVRGMTENGGDVALVRAAIDLGHNLGLEVVAEGVESAALQRLLEELGCDTLQGFHLGRPAPPSALAGTGGPAAGRPAVA
ncbi:MAG TPA: EAL domain-containing protein [Gaiellaceae bacterium]|nr:EAL domain-containing protein [Gaiellaceae bacterium]